jgi:hypothetical protein
LISSGNGGNEQKKEKTADSGMLKARASGFRSASSSL